MMQESQTDSPIPVTSRGSFAVGGKVSVYALNNLGCWGQEGLEELVARELGHDNLHVKYIHSAVAIDVGAA